MTYYELLDSTSSFLKENGLKNDIIFQIIYGLDENVNSLTDIADNINEQIDNEIACKILDGLYDYVYNNKPLSYITHSNNFCGNKLIIDDNVLPPRPETEEWTKMLIDTIRNCGELRILDLCCGSGAIGLTVKKALPYCNVVLADISSMACANARKNAQKMELNVGIVQSNLFTSLVGETFDVIVFNPPYVDVNAKIDICVSKYEPYNAIYAPNRGLWFYDSILKDISKHLNDRFLIMMEIGFNLAGDVVKLVKKYLGLEPEVYVDSNYNDRVIVINRL